MALNKENLIQLGKTLARADRGASTAYSYEGKDYSYEALNEAFRKELNEYAGTYALYRENKNLIFSVIEEVINDVLPKKVDLNYGQFAKTMVMKQGDKPIFRRKNLGTRTRAKQFITRVGLAGVYEVFKLGKLEESFEVPTSAVGGAAQIGFEEFLDGRVDFAELINIVMDGIDETIFKEVEASMKAAVNQLPPANRVIMNDFDEGAFDGALQIVAAYGTPIIYCTNEFAMKLVPRDGWRYSDRMKEQLWNTGRLGNYKGYQVVILPQGFEDETNTTKVRDPGYCWIMPAGADNKPVYIVFEGNTAVDDRKNDDWSREVQVYTKVGVATMFANNICCVVDTSLVGQMETWYTGVDLEYEVNNIGNPTT